MKHNYFLQKLSNLLTSHKITKKHLVLIGLLFIITQINAQNCTVNAGLNQTICQNDSLVLDGSSSGSVQSGPVWSQVGGPSVVITDPANPNTTITGFSGGNTYVFRYSATCTIGGDVFQDVSITVEPITIANAGSDIASCPDSSGSIIISGNNPANPGETGVWSVVGGNGAGVNINFPTSATTPITLSASSAGTSTLRWTITGPDYAPGQNCESFDEIIVTNFGGVEPVDAGSDQTLSNCYTATQSTSLSGTFGGNNINGQQGTWTFVSGPNTPAIANVNDNTTLVLGLVEGMYTFRWDVSGPCANGSDTVNITVPAATQDVSNATIQDDNQRFCDASVTQTTLVGSDPDFTNETVLWEQIDGNPPVTIVDPTNPTTQVTGLTAPNSYQFRYTITNNITGCTSSDTGRVRYNTNPVSITVNSGADIVGACGDTSVDIPFTFTGGNQTQYSIINGPADSAIGFPTSFQNAGGNSVTISSFDAPGTYTISFRRRSTGQVLSSCDEATDDIRVTISLLPTGANAGTSQNLICGETTGSLAGNVVSIGTSTWSQVSGPNTATIADIYASTTGVSNLVPGLYTFRYSISGGGACPVETSDTQIFVSSAVTGPSNAGTNQSVCFNAPVQLAANTPTEDQIGTWSGPPDIVFEDVNDPNTIATGFSSPSTLYTLQWSIDNTTVNCGAPSVSTVDITTSAQESPTTSSAGSDQCLPGGTTTVTLAANNPDVDEQGLWTVNPAAGVAFTDATQANTTATVPSDGTYIFTWTIDYITSNGCAPTSDDLEVTIASTASANAGPDQTLCANSFTMAADPATPLGVGTWSLVSGNGGFTVDNINSPTATFSNLLDGTYVFQWRIDYGNCSFATDEVSITVGIPPSTANIPGGDQIICSGTSTTITADPISDPNTESGVWTLLSGAPNTPTITNPGNNSTTVTGLTTGSYTFRWTISGNSPLCPSTSDEIIVEVYAPASAGPDQDLCEATSVFLEATSGTTGTWTQVVNGAPASTITQSPANSNTANASVVPGNTYIFEYTTDYIGSGAACNNSDQVTIVVSSGPSIDPDAGPDQDICIADTGGTATLAGNAPPADVNPATWTFVSEPSGSVAVIDSPNSENSTISNLTVPGLYILQWNFESNFCTDKADIVRIQVYEAPSTANAGADQPNACQLDAQLNATAPTVGLGTWSFENPGDDPSGGAAIIDSPNNPNSTLSNITTLGTYVLTWTVSNGPFTNPSLCEPSTDTVAITFTDVPPSQANAGSDQELCNADQTTFEAIPVSAGTGTWDQISGPNIATIASPNNPNSLVFGMIEGVYEFRWTTSNGGCSFEDFVQITILSQPITAEAGPNQVVPEFSSITLGATPPTVGQGTWDQVSGPNTATIINPNDPNSQVTGTAIGTYIFRWTVSNGGCPSVSDTVQIEVVGNSDLELTKLVLPASAKVGEVVTFTLVVFNNNASGGNSNADGVTVVDAIPAGYTLVAGTVSNGGSYNAGNFTITWSNLSIANGNTLNLTFDATVNGTGTYDNSAEITASNQFDPDSTPGNNVPTEDDQSSVAVTIVPNDPPVAVNDDSLANTAGTTVNVMILVNDSDADGTIDPSSVNLTAPGGATNIITDLSGDVIGFTVAGEGVWLYDNNTGELSFTPEAGFTGNPTDVEYTVRDNDGNTSNVATVNVEYTPAPPVANNDNNAEATPIGGVTTEDILANDVLADGSVPSPSDVTVDLDTTTAGVQTTLVVAGEGTWSYDGVSGEVSFTPEASFTGSPTPITYELTDIDNAQSDTATITYTYQQVPVAVNDDSLANTAGTTANVMILVNDSDADGTLDAASVNLTTPGGATNIITDLSGDVIGFTVAGEGVWLYDNNTGELSFTPEAGFTGNPTDVAYTVRDNDGNTSNVATVNVEYTPAAPIANNDSNAVATAIGGVTTEDILANDVLADGSVPLPSDVTVDLDFTTAGVQTTLVVAGEGTWSYDGVSGEVSFIPEVTFTGSPTPITYELTDIDNGQSATATITYTYQQVPVAVNDDSLANTAGTTANVMILVNDSDADGTLDAASVNLVVPGGATDVVTDLSGDVIGFTVVGEGVWLYDNNTGELSFTPEAGFTGNPTDVDYTVRDNDGNTSNVATVNVEYTPAAPVANNDSNAVATVIGGVTTEDILANDVLADGSVPSPSDVTVNLDTTTAGVQTTLVVAGEGTWSYDGVSGEVSFTPEASFTGSPTPITYELTDIDNAQSATATIIYTYQQVPVAVNDNSLANTAGTTANVMILVNDSDADGTIDPSSVNLTTPVGATNIITDLSGDVIGFTVAGEGVWLYDNNTGELSFTPEAGFTGNPTDVEYTVRDNDGNTSNVATVNVEYTPAAPVANDDSSSDNVTTNPVDVNLLTNDVLADGSVPTPSDVIVDLVVPAGAITTITGGSGNVIGFTVPGEGTWLYDESTGVINFTPEAGFTNDPTPIEYNITDADNGVISVAPATVTIDYAIQAPVAVADTSVNNTPETSVAISILTNDTDPDGTLDPNGVDLIPPAGATGIVTDADGDVIEFTVPGEGIWVYDPVTEVLTFTPQTGFITDPTPIDYTVDDNDGNSSNVVSVTVDYEDVADLSLTKTVVDNDVTPFTGTEITFEVVVTNDGPANATGVIVTDILPTGYDFILYSSTTGVYDETTGIWTVGSIANGTSETLLIDVLVNETGNYVNTAEITASNILDLDSTPNNGILTEDDQDEVLVTPVLTPRIDLSVTKMADTMTPDVGGQITFTMTVTNDGPSDATNVVVTDLLDSGYEYVSSTVTTGVYERLNGSWTIGNLATTVTETLTITARVLAQGDYTNVVEVTDALENDIDSTPANNDDTEDDQVTIEPVPIPVSDLSITKNVNNTTPNVGSIVQFTVLLENLGLSDARGIEVTDLLPTGYTFSSFEATAGTYNEITGIWRITRTILNGDIERLTISAVVNPTGDYTNTASITASDNVDSDTTNNSDSAGTTPVQIADLSLVKTVDNANPDVTDVITFTLTLTNDGPSEATGIEVTDLLPSGFNWISDTSAGAYNSTSGIWTVGTLAIGSTITIDITASINTTGSYVNIAEVTSANEIDPDSVVNNSVLSEDDMDQIQVFPRVITDISITKMADNLNPSVGDQITFTITTTNDGPSNATGVIVEDILASGYQFVSATPSSGVYDETIGSWNIGNMINGATETLNITVIVLPSGIYSNIAELIALDTFDPDSTPDNNIDSEDDQDTVTPIPVGLADLSIEKLVDNATPLIGDMIQFTINLTNSGDSDATGVVVSDLLSAGYTFDSYIATAGLYEATTGLWNINGTILNGTTETLIILATVNAPTGTANEYENSAVIMAADQADPDSDSSTGIDQDDYSDGIVDDDEAIVEVFPQFVDLAVSKIVDTPNASIGDDVIFIITVTNDSSLDATNVEIEDVLPTGYRFVSSEATNGSYNEVAGIWSIPNVNINSSETLAITVTVLDIDDYLNTAELLTVDQFDTNDANNSGEAFIEPGCLNIFNEFSPNGDGTNETFVIDCISRYPNNRLEIYNRWGNIVFQKDGYDNSWDGTSNGRAVLYTEDKLPVGTYFYVLDLGDGSEKKTGWLYINR